jgi:hypothetical protein
VAGRLPGLAELAELPLTPRHQQAYAGLLGDMLGPPAWRQRKRAEARCLLALAQIAPRLEVRQLDLRTSLLAQVGLRDMPVPCMLPGSNDVRIERGALLAIEYPEEILRAPIPGTQPVRICAPRFVFHSNVGPYGANVAALCLGASVPRGLPLVEMLLMSYGALTLQAISLDAMDPAGVLNPEAAQWWQRNAARTPLTAEPFLGWRRAGSPQAGTSQPDAGVGEGRP